MIDLNKHYNSTIQSRGARTSLLCLTVAAALVLVSCSASDSGETKAQTSTLPQSSTAVVRAAAQPLGTALRDLHLISENSAWVLTDRGIWWSNDFARTWANKPLPTQLQPETIGNAFFLDEQNGWLVSQNLRPNATNPMDFIVLHTQDGGQSWSSSSLYPNYTGYVEEPGGLFYINFIDPQHGWVMVRDQTSAADDKGTLFQTIDGGVSWNRVSAPSGGPVHFINPSDGWAMNMPLARLYATHDGGTTWQEQVLPGIPQHIFDPNAEDKTPPADPNAIVPTYELPTFFNQKDGVLAVTFAGERAAVRFYITHDTGVSWSLASTVDVNKPTAGAIIPTAATTPNDWMMILPNNTIHRTTNAGVSWQDERIPSLPEGTANLMFVSSTHGWAQSSVGHCAEDKTHCSIQTQLLVTEDGGHTWRPSLMFTRPM